MVGPFMRYRMEIGCCECAALPECRFVPAPWLWQRYARFSHCPL